MMLIDVIKLVAGCPMNLSSMSTHYIIYAGVEVRTPYTPLNLFKMRISKLLD